MPLILCRFQAVPLLEARSRGERKTQAVVDLGMRTVGARLQDDGVVLDSGERINWEALEEIAGSDTACFSIENGEARRIHAYSEEYGRHYSLWPTARAPTIVISGVPMHRIKDIDPLEDTLRKIRALGPISDRVLDTATGLGYTAIQAAKAAEVVTIELDPLVLELARLNPWSAELFENQKIHQLIGDAAERIHEFGDRSFHCVIHDPPVLSLAGHLYSLEFYRQLYRVLQRGGRLFHYVGDPEGKASARNTRGVVRRLQEAGFRRVVQRPEAFGVVAYR